MNDKVGGTRASNQFDDNEDDIEDYAQYKAARLLIREQQLHPPETSTEMPFTKDLQDTLQDDQKPPGKPSQHLVAAPAVVMSRSTLDDDKQFISQENLHLNLHLQNAEAYKDGRDNSNNLHVESGGATAICNSSSTAAAFTTGKSKNQGGSIVTDGMQSRQPGVQFIRRLAPGLTFDSVMIRQARESLHAPSNQPPTATLTAPATDTSTATVVAVEQSQSGSAFGKKCNRKVILAAAVISLCLVIAIVLGVVLGTSNRHDSNNNTLGGQHRKRLSQHRLMLLLLTVVTFLHNPIHTSSHNAIATAPYPSWRPTFQTNTLY
jgi:hypothetical protein